MQHFYRWKKEHDQLLQYIPINVHLTIRYTRYSAQCAPVARRKYISYTTFDSRYAIAPREENMVSTNRYNRSILL